MMWQWKTPRGLYSFWAVSPRYLKGSFHVTSLTGSKIRLLQSRKYYRSIKVSKYISNRPIICINCTPLPFQAKLHLVKVPLPSKCEHCESRLTLKETVFEILWSEVWKKGFQLMQILGRLNMCLDAAVVFAPTLHFYSDLLCEYFVLGRDSPSGEPLVLG